MLKIHGVSPSPFVRKVRIVLEEKNLAYDLNPIMPGAGDDALAAISPLGKIPVLEEDGWTMPDSSVIIAYLEATHPDPPVYPVEARLLARARWFEEYADTALVSVIGPDIFWQRVVGPAFRGQVCDESVVRTAIDEKLPPLFDYIEGELGSNDYLAGDFSIADISVVSMLINMAHASELVDGARWPGLAGLYQRVVERPTVARLIAEERELFQQAA
jgi:glutathione S-transferase